MVSARDSARGKFFPKSLYFRSSFGWYGLSSLIGGGGTANDRRHSVTCSSPYFSVVSALFMPCKSPYMRSFKRQDFSTGTQSWSISSKAKLRVLIARYCNEVKARSTEMFASRNNTPAFWASAAPVSDTSTSTHPVKRFSKFHCDSPCRR